MQERNKLITVITSLLVWCVNLNAQVLDSNEIIFSRYVLPLVKSSSQWQTIKTQIPVKYKTIEIMLMAKIALFDQYVRPLLDENADWSKVNQIIESTFQNDVEVRTWAARDKYEKIIKPQIIENKDWLIINKLIKTQRVWGSISDLYLFAVNDYKSLSEKGTSKTAINDFISSINRYMSIKPININPMEVNSWCWYVFENSDDRNHLKQALSWGKIMIIMAPKSGEFLDTYANLLYKVGKKDEALKCEEKALQLEIKQGVDTGVKSNYDKMKAGIQTW